MMMKKIYLFFCIITLVIKVIYLIFFIIFFFIRVGCKALWYRIFNKKKKLSFIARNGQILNSYELLNVC